MYEELVKRLREAPNDWPDAGLHYEAADAIEELSKLADAIPHVCECCVGCELEKKNGGCDNAFVLSPKRAMQYLIKPRWIPVTERLPDDYQLVLTCDGHKNIHMMAHTKKYKYPFGISPEHPRYYMVKYWMPLPEPPTADNGK